MNFAIVCTRNPAFLAFKKAIGHDSALEFLFKLVERCQSEKTTEHYLPDDYIVAALGAPDDLNPETANVALIKHRILTAIDGTADTYGVTLFTDQNAGLLASWENGRKGGREKGAEAVPPVPSPAAIPVGHQNRSPNNPQVVRAVQAAKEEDELARLPRWEGLKGASR